MSLNEQWASRGRYAASRSAGFDVQAEKMIIKLNHLIANQSNLSIPSSAFPSALSVCLLQRATAGQSRWRSLDVSEYTHQRSISRPVP